MVNILRGLLGAIAVEFALIPAVAGWCRGEGCVSNTFGVGLLHILAVACLICGAVATFWPAITSRQKLR